MGRVTGLVLSSIVEILLWTLETRARFAGVGPMMMGFASLLEEAVLAAAVLAAGRL